MKKPFIVMMIILFCIILGIGFIYSNYTIQVKQAKEENKQYEYYLGKRVYGSVVATLINKAVDNNEKNQVQKDSKGNYINNEENSIQIDLDIVEVKKTYPMESIYQAQIKEFMKNFGDIQFECKKIEYHEKTGKIKYMLFEEVLPETNT